MGEGWRQRSRCPAHISREDFHSFLFNIFCEFFINYFFDHNILHGTTLTILALCLWEHLSQLALPVSEPPTMELLWMTTLELKMNVSDSIAFGYRYS